MSEDNQNDEPLSNDDFDGGFDMDMPEVPMPEPAAPAQTIEDKHQTSFKLGIIGSGQGGGRIAKAFYDTGYRRVCVINTAEQDLNTSGFEPKQRMLVGQGGGAGKNPAAARETFLKEKENVLDFMKRSFGEELDRTIVCIGAGGGTGAGTAEHLVDCAIELQTSLKCPTKKVGVIVALPKISEGAKVCANAYHTLNALVKLAKEGFVSPLVIIDNEKINQLYKNLSTTKFWETANKSIASLFNLFNVVTTKNSSFVSFDPNDFKTVLDSGIIVFGAAPVAKWDSETDISYAIRDNLSRNIISDGIDLKTGTTAACVVIGGRNILDDLPQSHLDHGFEQLTRILGPGSTIHRGIYSSNAPNLVVYTMIGGLDAPQAKLEELKKLGNVVE